MDLVRLACVRHTASVRPEPGSNSPWNFYYVFKHFSRTKTKEKQIWVFSFQNERHKLQIRPWHFFLFKKTLCFWFFEHSLILNLTNFSTLSIFLFFYRTITFFLFLKFFVFFSHASSYLFWTKEKQTIRVYQSGSSLVSCLLSLVSCLLSLVSSLLSLLSCLWSVSQRKKQHGKYNTSIIIYII